MQLHIFIQLVAQCNNLIININDKDEFSDKFNLDEFLNERYDIIMESDADEDITGEPCLIIKKVNDLVADYLEASKEKLVICFRERDSPTIRSKTIEEFQKELQEPLNEELTDVIKHTKTKLKFFKIIFF